MTGPGGAQPAGEPGGEPGADPGGEPGVPRPPASVACVGAGTMGAGIALAFALGGTTTAMVARRKATLDAAWRRIGESVSLLAAAGRVPGGEREAVLERITGTTDLDGADLTADLVVESVAEDVAVKRRLYEAIEPRLGSSTILGTCTSSLPLGELAAGLARPERFIGYHWFNPPELVALVEIVPAERTAAAVTDRVEAFSLAIGKQPVRVAADVPGFVANRLQYALIREAYHLVAAGVCTPADVDRVVTAGLGPRWAAIGPFASMDLAGLDVHRQVAEQLFPRLSAGTAVPPMLTALAAEGALGVKSGRGLLGSYGEQRVREVIGLRARVLLALDGMRRLTPPAWAEAGAAGPEADRGPERNSVPQITAPAAKMIAVTQKPVV
jgi:3-hydroxybutyryl-CoA dehydrogenase